MTWMHNTSTLHLLSRSHQGSARFGLSSQDSTSFGSRTYREYGTAMSTVERERITLSPSRISSLETISCSVISPESAPNLGLDALLCRGPRITNRQFVHRMTQIELYSLSHICNAPPAGSPPLVCNRYKLVYIHLSTPSQPA